MINKLLFSRCNLLPQIWKWALKKLSTAENFFSRQESPLATFSVQFVSEFTGNKMEGEKLERVYQKIKSGKASAAAVHSIGAGTSGMHLRNRFKTPSYLLPLPLLLSCSCKRAFLNVPPFTSLIKLSLT